MSDISSLSQLARFVGKSRLSSPDQDVRRKAIGGMVERMQPKPVRKKATDMLGLVLVLSARTRRLVQPRTNIDLDVFSPLGQRAVQLRVGNFTHVDRRV